MFAKRDRPSACTDLEARLEDYLEGLLPPSQAAVVENHVRGCARCAAALDGAKLSVNLLSAVRTRLLPEASPFFAGRVMSAIRHEHSDEELWKPLEVAGWELCWLAVAAALILAFVMFRVRVPGSQLRANANVAQAQVQELINVPMTQPAVQDDTLLVASTNDNGR